MDSAIGHSPEHGSTLTIHVYNYDEVSPETLMKAEKTASGIFRKAGVETRWLNKHPHSENKKENSADPKPLYPDIQLTILSRLMATLFLGNLLKNLHW